ncbi:hypothetical protein PGTUg99_036627 [Puccinia graminis f. sp. tritici]|uniref:Uncharacterized protein n=1 Tax=Puccinia graminis f. sp. tritici TaxID=56615 RepID=A0A5B0SHC0_PUCGR|nr:hypothetical protein PGTUg99_036627 [Puccinia graminis f. sp. tritici]
MALSDPTQELVMVGESVCRLCGPSIHAYLAVLPARDEPLSGDIHAFYSVRLDPFECLGWETDCGGRDREWFACDYER